MHERVVEFLQREVSGCNPILNSAEIGDSSITVDSKYIFNVCRSLRDSSEFQMNVLQTITGCDYPEYVEVSYILASFIKNTELILKVKLNKMGQNELVEVDSVSNLWKAANFCERECYDLLGVEFTNHPDMRRILCPYDWQGYPLRKDYVVQEVYNDMKVDPPDKINTSDHFFYKELMAKVDDPKKVAYSWKEDNDAKK